MRFYFAPVSRHMRANFFVSGEQVGTSETLDLWASLIYPRHKQKKQKLWNQQQSPKFPLGWRQHRGIPMSGSLLDQCRESILRIAETQPPDGRRAMLVMAELFRANSGRASSEGRRPLSQDLHTPAPQPVVQALPIIIGLARSLSSCGAPRISCDRICS
jgi:hypothetical protein